MAAGHTRQLRIAIGFADTRCAFIHANGARIIGLLDVCCATGLLHQLAIIVCCGGRMRNAHRLHWFAVLPEAKGKPC